MGSLAELKAWFGTLSADEKKRNGREFNRRKAELAVARPAPSPPRKGHWARIKCEINPDSDMVKAGYYVAGYEDIFIPDRS